MQIIAEILKEAVGITGSCTAEQFGIPVGVAPAQISVERLAHQVVGKQAVWSGRDERERPQPVEMVFYMYLG